jgi:hypothetical protein
MSVVIKAVITDNCRKIHGSMGAFDEAARRAREVYESTLKAWEKTGVVPVMNLILDVERPDR